MVPLPGGPGVDAVRQQEASEGGVGWCPVGWEFRLGRQKDLGWWGGLHNMKGILLWFGLVWAGVLETEPGPLH